MDVTRGGDDARVTRHPSFLLAAALLVAVSTGARAAPSGEIPCTVANAGFDAAELVCAIAPATPMQELRFQATFLGVHDDTSVGLGVKLDGRPLACAAGSRPRLQGDADGDTLSCAMQLAPGAATRELRVQLVWYHAQPASYSLRRE